MTTQRKRRPRRSWGMLRRRASGRWEASYMHNLARHTAPITFTARMDGEAWLASERRLIERDEWTPPQSRAAQRKAQATTLSEYAGKWTEQRNLKAGTKIEYQRIKARLIDKTIGRVPLRNITSDAVRGWYASLGTDTPRRNSHAYGLLQAILGTAVADGLLTANPAMVTRAMNPPTKRDPMILSVDEIATVAERLAPQQFRPLVLVSAWCGLRWGELIELRRRDIGDNCEVITVARAATHRSGCKIDTPKSGKGRTSVVPPHIRADENHHLDVFIPNDPEALVSRRCAADAT